MQKRQLGPCVTFFPQPTTLVTTVDETGRADVMTASWAGIVSKTPPTMAVSFNQGRQSYANIRQSGAFVVNMVPAKLAVEADYCGLRSGRDEDKAEIAGLTLVPGSKVAVPVIEQCPLNVECRVSGELVLGDYRLVLGEIVEIHACEAAFGEEGAIDAKVFDPLVYLGGIRQYWDLGQRVADAYRDGAQLFAKKD